MEHSLWNRSSAHPLELIERMLRYYMRYFVIISICAGLSKSQDPSSDRLRQLLLPSIKLIYEYENESESKASVQSIEAEVLKLTRIRDTAAQEAVVILLQFDFDENVKKQAISYVISRGRSILPLLKKYRDSPYRLPGSNFRNSFRLTPEDRVVLFDSLMEKIEGVMVTGLSPQVNGLLIPLLTNLEAASRETPDGAKSSDEFNRLLESLVADQSKMSDESLVILLDYNVDASYSQMVSGEIAERGPRMLKFLMAYQYKPTVSLAAHFKPGLRRDCDSRTMVYESLIEMIRMGEVTGR